MDDARLAAALVVSTEMERALRYYLAIEESPLDLASGWTAYRNVVGLRKALGHWLEMRAARDGQRVHEPIGA